MSLHGLQPLPSAQGSEQLQGLGPQPLIISEPGLPPPNHGCDAVPPAAGQPQQSAAAEQFGPEIHDHMEAALVQTPKHKH